MRVAIVQDGPEYLDLNSTINKTINYLEKAKKESADLVVFGECWLSGYPTWLDVGKDVNIWNRPRVKQLWAQMHENSINLQSKSFQRLTAAVADTGMWVVIGANEVVSSGPGQGTIYNSILTFNRSGVLSNHHRKLMPTYTERLVHGTGDGAGLKSVQTEFGRLGSLICWEHWMPLTRQAMHDEGEDLHIALWPMVKEMNHVACRQYAFEGRCTVIAVGQVMAQSEMPEGIELSDEVQLNDNGLIMSGGSAVYGPDGKFILPQVYNERKLIVTELDLKQNVPERMNLDVTGHYQRKDVFSFSVNKERT